MKPYTKWILQIIVAIAGICAIYFVLKPYRASHLLRKGQDLIEIKKYDEALQSLENAKELDPVNPRIHYHIGQIYGLKGYFEKQKANGQISLDAKYNLERSISEFKEAAQTLHDVTIQYNLGISYELIENYNDAFKAFELAYKYKPEYKDVALKLSEMSVILGDEDKLELAIKCYPQNYSAYIKLGRIYYKSNRLSLARDLYKELWKYCNWIETKNFIEGQSEKSRQERFDIIVDFLLTVEMEQYDEAVEMIKELIRILGYLPDEILNKNTKESEDKLSTKIINTSWSKLLPRDFLEFTSCLSISHVKILLEKLGFSVFFPSQKISNNGVEIPLDIEMKSSTDRANLISSIKVFGKEYSTNKRGFNGIVLELKTFRIKNRGNFDTYADPESPFKLAGFIENIDEGDIVILSVRDEGSRMLNDTALKALKTLGSINLLDSKHLRWSYILIGVKGAKEPTSIELASRNPIIYRIFKGFKIDNPDEFFANREIKIPTFYFSGLEKESSLKILYPLL
jgi:tetratricopeptide (TPR) repeat protein